jgi:hypothetical protein
MSRQCRERHAYGVCGPGVIAAHKLDDQYKLFVSGAGVCAVYGLGGRRHVCVGILGVCACCVRASGAVCVTANQGVILGNGRQFPFWGPVPAKRASTSIEIMQAPCSKTNTAAHHRALQTEPASQRHKRERRLSTNTSTNGVSIQHRPKLDQVGWLELAEY